MPEIGQTLRETRLRNRVDITEVEAGTKIRAKYLRALENEEWDLLPGPTFVKTFLRSYADYLGLDSRLLVEEYKQRFERPSTMELTPFSPRSAAGGRNERRRRGILGPALVVLVGIVALLGALYALGTWGGDDNGGRAREHDRPRRPRRRRRPPRARSSEGRGADACHPADRAHRDRQRLPRRRERQGADQQRDPGGGRARRGATAAAASASPSATARRGCASGGRTIDVPDRSTPVGYELRPGKRPRELSAARRPTCS